ncbi:MAG: hypothetical protein NT086_08865 [Proteobacteria bacterium]|nr:hypothetical protein [Pseudomonadota bacterium]
MSRAKAHKPQAHQQLQVNSKWRTFIVAKPLIQTTMDAEKERISAEQLKLRQIRRSVEDHLLSVANRDPLFN